MGVLSDPQLEPNTIEGLPPFALREAVAWIDYARVDLRMGRSKLRLEWDQDSGGSVEGPRAVLDELHVLDPWTQMQARHLPH
jgi:hypothetical protein